MPNKISSHTRIILEAQKKASLICIILIVALFTNCEKKAEKVTISRFEQLIFTTSPEQLHDALVKNASTYNTQLLNIAPDNEEYMQMLQSFVGDQTMRTIYHVTDSLYHDLDWLEQELGDALQQMSNVYKELRYDHFYTLITGDLDDYQNRVFCDDHSLAISIDHYTVGALKGVVPQYIERMSRKEYIASDCIAAIARAHIALPDGDPTLLDYAIAEGKTLYFLEKTIPGVHDTIRLRYSKQQLNWMEENVKNVWSWMIQNQMLYSNNIKDLRNFIGEAPKTNAFGEGSAPRTHAYIGLLIVRKYMKESHATMQQLFEETDGQKILTQSTWRP